MIVLFPFRASENQNHNFVGKSSVDHQLKDSGLVLGVWFRKGRAILYVWCLPKRKRESTKEYDMYSPNRKDRAIFFQ